MDDIQFINEEIIKKVDFLNQKIEKDKKIILINNIVNKNSRINKIYLIQAIMNQSLQYGNYKRAFKYYLLADFLLKNLEKQKDKILRNFTLNLIK